MAEARAKILITAEDRTKAAFDSVARSFEAIKHIIAAREIYEGIKAIVEAGAKAEQNANRLTVAYKLQGEQLGITRKELDEMAESLAGATQFDDNDFKKGEAELLKFGNIYGDTFKEALKLSADLAAFNGTDLVTANQALGKALSNPIEGVKGLGAAYNKFTAEQREHIKVLVEQNKGLEVQQYILGLVRGSVGGTAEAMNTGYTKAIEDTAKAWDKFKEALAGIVFIKDTVTGALDAIASSLRGVASVFNGGTYNEGSLGKQTAMAKQITDLQFEIQQRESRKGLTFTDDEGRVMGEDLKVDELKKKLQELEAEYKKLYQTQAEGHKAAQPNFGMTADQLAFIKDIKRQTDAVGQGPIGALFAKADELHLGGKTRAQIQALGQAIKQAADDADRAKDRNEAWKKAFTFTDDQREAITNLQLQTKNLTEYREQAELNTEQQRIDNDIRKTAIGMTEQQSAAFREQASVLEVEYLTAFQKMQDEARKWQTGFSQAMNEILDYSTNTAAQVKGLFGNAFHSLEDMLVDFAMTGKLNFKDMANSIISDLIRIRIQQSIIAPLSSALSGAAGAVGDALGFFGVNNGVGGTVSVGASSYGPASTGGIPGRAGGGDINAGMPYWVGERGPELVVPRNNGTVIPSGKTGDGGNVYHIDARGASLEAVQELRKMVIDLDRSFDQRAYGAVRSQRARSSAGF